VGQRPQRQPRARAAVLALPGTGGGPILRALPSGRSLLIGFAIVAGAIGLYALARVTPAFALQRIEVEGAPAPVAAHVRAALVRLEGTSLLALDGGEVERRISPLTDVASVTYDRDFPHTLRVVVRAEHPAAIARQGADAWLVSTSARVLARVRPDARRSLPRVWLTASGEPQVGSAIGDRYGLRAVRALALARRDKLRLHVLMVRARPHELTFLLGSGVQLRLGDLRAVPLKLAVAARVLPRVLAHGGYAYLDVSVPERPVVGTNPKVSG
jgi:cell division protein FtsQ